MFNIEHVIVIVGAGICGLAAAYELARRGERAVVFERGEPFAEQSAGLARIFRIAHRRPVLCRLAMQARVGWQRWETELGADPIFEVPLNPLHCRCVVSIFV